MTAFHVRLADRFTRTVRDCLAAARTVGGLEVLRPYLGQPRRFLREVLGLEVVAPTTKMLDAIEAGHRRIMVRSAQGLGKTFLGGALVIYFMVVEALRAGPDGQPLGALSLTMGPSSNQVRKTVLKEARGHARRLRDWLRRKLGRPGYQLPGHPWNKGTADSTIWQIPLREDWMLELITPPKGEDAAHGGAGRHHPNIVFAFVEEAADLDAGQWRTVLGSVIGERDIVVAVYNPYDRPGTKRYQTMQRTVEDEGFVEIELDAFEHPNIRERRTVIAGAVSHVKLDDDVRTHCDELGPFPELQPDPRYHDFVYALPPKDTDVPPAPRADGLSGDAAGAPRVYRPRSATFAARWRGRVPLTDSAGLIDTIALERSIERHNATPDPERDPDWTSLDTSQGERDRIMLARYWGPPPQVLLTEYLEALVDPDGERGAARCAELHRRRGRISLEEIDLRGGVAPGPEIARQALALHPRIRDGLPITVETVGTGQSTLDHLQELGIPRIVRFDPSASPPHDLPGGLRAYNCRTWSYLMISLLLLYDLLDLPDSPRLRLELGVHEVEYRKRVDEDGAVEVAQLLRKKTVKARLGGTSPDEADACAFVLFQVLGAMAFDDEDLDAAFGGTG